MDESDVEDRTIYCGNLCEEVTEAILFELFNQAGPVETVRRPKDVTGRLKTFGFIIYKHDCSVPYALELFRSTKLFNKHLNINSRSRARHVPVLDTHLNDSNMLHMQPTHGQKRSRNDTGYSNKRDDSRNLHDRRSRRHEDRNSHKERDSEPTSWSALKGQGLSAKGYRNDMDPQNSSRSRSSDFRPEFYGAQNSPDFSALLQLGQQMMNPGMLPQMPFQNLMHVGPGAGLGEGPNMFPSMQGRYEGGRVSPDRHRHDQHARIDGPGMIPPMGPSNLMGMGLGPGLGAGPMMFPSMQGGYDGGRVSPDRQRNWTDYRGERHTRRDSPYERRPDHYQHGSRYSSSRSSHDRRSR